VVDASVVATKGADANHSHVNKVVSQLFNSPGSQVLFGNFAVSFAKLCGQGLLTKEDAKGTAEFAKELHFAAFFRRAIWPA
jgi:hypothetical protein